jgi:xanthine/uracil permease
VKLLTVMLYLVPMILAVFSMAVSIYGLILAFQVSILLGILVLIIEPAPLVIGVVMIFWGVNLAQVFYNWVLTFS